MPLPALAAGRTLKLVVSIAAVLVIIGLVMWGPAACSRLIAEREARKIESGQHEATLDSLDMANRTEAAAVYLTGARLPDRRELA